MKNISEHHESQTRQRYHRCPVRLQITAFTSWVTESFAVGAATAASLVMNEYQHAVMAQQPRAEEHSSRMEPGFSLGSFFGHKNGSSESGQPQPDRLLAIIPDPGPVHLVVACMVYSTAINVFYHIHRRDRYQLGIVTCGALSALVVGWVSKQDTRCVITGLGTWAVMVSLLLSAAFHKLLRDYGGEARMSS